MSKVSVNKKMKDQLQETPKKQKKSVRFSSGSQNKKEKNTVPKEQEIEIDHQNLNNIENFENFEDFESDDFDEPTSSKKNERFNFKYAIVLVVLIVTVIFIILLLFALYKFFSNPKELMTNRQKDRPKVAKRKVNKSEKSNKDQSGNPTSEQLEDKKLSVEERLKMIQEKNVERDMQIRKEREEKLKELRKNLNNSEIDIPQNKINIQILSAEYEPEPPMDRIEEISDDEENDESEISLAKSEQEDIVEYQSDNGEM